MSGQVGWGQISSASDRLDALVVRCCRGLSSARVSKIDSSDVRHTVNVEVSVLVVAQQL